MIHNLLVSVFLGVVSALVWYYWPLNPSLQSDITIPIDETASSPDSILSIDLTDEQIKKRNQHTKEIDNLIHSQLNSLQKIPNISQSIKLPKLKSLKQYDLADDLLELKPRSANPAIDSDSTHVVRVTRESNPLIRSVSKQTGIPEEDLEAAFNQE